MLRLRSNQSDSNRYTRWQGNNGAVYKDKRCFLDLDLHKTNNFAPNEYKGLVNSSGLVVYKGSTQEIKGTIESKS